MRQARRSDLPEVLRLLEQHKLPTAGVADHLNNYLLEFEDQTLIGCVGLEVYAQAGLLRSVVVAPNNRSRGLATKLVRTILEQAMQHLSSISLLTETAQDYFSRFGFQITPRADLPGSLHASAEFRGACPDSATAMMLKPS